MRPDDDAVDGGDTGAHAATAIASNAARAPGECDADSMAFVMTTNAILIRYPRLAP